MPPEKPASSTTQAQIFAAYTALTETLPAHKELGLGGKLLYAGDIDTTGRTLLFAGNIAGAASLAATADHSIQRQAIRDGAVDFLVTSLEEALRILKNEIRQRKTVSVGVAIEPCILTAAMLDRGVLPDLLTPEASSFPGFERFLTDGAIPIAERALEGFTTWGVDAQFAKWMPRLDACVQTVVPAGDWVRQRWLRLAPRYLGRQAQREHGVQLDHVELELVRRRVMNIRSEFAAEPPVVIKFNGQLL